MSEVVKMASFMGKSHEYPVVTLSTPTITVHVAKKRKEKINQVYFKSALEKSSYTQIGFGTIMFAHNKKR